MDTIETLLPVIMGGAIWPIVGLLKITKIPIRPEFLALVLAIAAAWGLTIWLAPGTEWSAIINMALAAVGTSTVLVAGKKSAVSKNNHSLRGLAILIIAGALCLPAQASAQDVPADAKLVGATFGVTLNKDKAPEPTYSLSYQAPGLYKWTGGLFEKAVLGVVYQQKGIYDKAELYAARIGGLRGYQYKMLYVVYGVGFWYLANTTGVDYVRTATMLQLGVKTGPLDLYLGADAIDVGNSMTWYTFGGFLFDL